MIENTPEQRRKIAEKVNGTGKNGGRPTYIYSPEELVEQYREYARRDLLQRHDYDNLPPEKQRTVNMAADIYAEWAASSLKHDMPALIFFFRRYLTQH